MADPKIKFKRSAVAGKIPTAAQVPLGEIALNTNDGILYASKDVGAGTTVIAVNPFRVGTGTDSYNTFFTAGNVGIGSTQPTGKLDVLGQVNIKGSSTTTTSGIATSYTGSVEFDGTGDYLQISSNSDLSSGTGDFTFEAWVRSDVGTQNYSQCIYDNRSGTGSNTTGFFLGRMSAHSGKVELYSAGNYRNANGTAFTEGQWNHVAVVRHSNVIKLYLNGTKSGDDYNVTDDYSNTTARIGAAVNGTSTFYGEISNARFVKGTALYKSNFTPQTAELTEVYDTTLLACQSSSSATAEATGKTITANGNAAASTTNPSLVKGFDTSGSVYLDGTGDYLSIADSADLEFGSSNFTIEGWYYPVGENNASKALFNKRGSGNGGPLLYFDYNNNLTPRLLVYIGSNWNVDITSSITFTSSAWNHFAVVRNGSTFELFINGKSGGTDTNSGSIPDNSNPFVIGAMFGNGNNPIDECYISNFRIVNGSALYTSDFSPIFTELTELPNTKFLALQSASSATAYAVSPGAITAYGDATASSTSPGLISPNSLTGSVEFDGSGDDLELADSADWDYGTDPFTIEFYIYPDVLSGVRPLISVRQAGNGGWGAYWYNNVVYFIAGPSSPNISYTTSANALVANKWSHIAFVRNGNTFTTYIDGVSKGTTSSTNAVNNVGNDVLTIGRVWPSGMTAFDGFISNLRIVKGTALYTSTFTPPREELTNVTNTKLLCCQSSSSATAEATGKTITANGNASASSTSPGLVKTYTNAGGSTTTTTTTPGNLLVSGITTATNRIDIKSDDSTPGRIDFYCESSNAHYTQLRSAAHASYSGIATVTLPTSTGTLLLTDGSGANLTNLNGSNISSGTVAAARVGALPASKITSGTFDAARIPTLNQNTTGTAALAEGLTGSPNITVSDVNVGGGLSVTGNSFFVGVVTFAAGTDGNIVLGDAATDNVVFNADVNSNIVPNTNNAYDLGSSSQKWRNLFISGNANIGGTLTYEDVTNIDSVGLSTFRAGVNITGTATATLFSGSGASLTNLPAANLTGTIPDARFPAALPAIDGSALTGITASGTGAIGGLTIKNQSGAVVGTAGSVSTIDFDGSAGVTVTATSGAAGIATVLISADLVTDTSPQLGGNLDLNGNNITGSGDIPAANLTGTLPAISGANLTNLNGSNISSGTVAAARVGALPASKITTGTFADARIPDLAASKVTSGTFDAARIPTLNQDTTGTAALAEGLTGSPTIGVSTITTTGSVGIGSTQPTGKLDVLGQVNIKGSSTTTTSGIATSYTGSVELDGNSDYLSVSDSTDLDVGLSNDPFTIETWVYPHSVGTNQIFGRGGGTAGWNGTNGHQYVLYLYNNKINFEWWTGSALSALNTSSGVTLSTNTWSHLAVSYDGTNVRVYRNGVQILISSSTTFGKPSSSNIFRIGSSPSGSSYFDGNFSNFRVIKGTALYKSNFTPQTAELTQVYNTTLLACQSSSSATAEATGKTVTAVGTAAASTTNPSLVKGFDISGSVLFDGVNDYLTVGSHADLAMGTGDFTIEMWVYSTDSSLNTQDRRFFASEANGTSSIQFGHINTTGGIVEYATNGSLGIRVTGTTDIRNRWAHVAVVRKSNTVTLYIDGKSEGTPATDSNSKSASNPTIGKYPGLSGHFKGNMSNVRVVKGTALYTSNFDPTFTELTNLPNTKFLALQSSSSVTAYAVSPGAISNYGATATTTSPGLISPNSITGSVEFDGTGDYLSIADSTDFDLGLSSDPFTIEMWVYPRTIPSGNLTILGRGGGTGGWNSTNGHQYLLFIYNNQFYFQRWTGSSLVSVNSSSGDTLTLNKWTHLAVSYDGTDLKVYRDGAQFLISSNATFGKPSNSNITRIGTAPASGGSYWDGFISNVRIVKGTALYTAAFTPSREELDSITNTKFLALQSSSSATTEVIGKTITANGNAAASTTSPGLVKAYTNAGGQTTTTTTTPGNLLVSGITTATNRIDIKSDDSTPGRIDFYCESSNAHYTQLRSAAHSAYSGIATVTLPTSSGTLLLSDGSGASLTNLPAANLTGTLPAISGANLTNLDASDLASGTIPDARFPATLPAISGANLTNVNATVAGISTAGTSTFNHVSVAGVATVSTAFYFPQYTTTARDAGTFNEGAMIYNTTLKKMEFYDGTNWVTLPGVTLGLGMGVF